MLATTFFTCNFETKAVIVDLDKAESEVKEFIGSSFNFFQTGKIEDAKSTFSDDAILIGTDAAEFYNGWDEIEPSIIAQLAIIKNAKFDTRNLQITLSSDGEMASYTSVVDFSFTVGGDDGAINNLRNSGVVKKINGDWRMTQVHWSVGLVGQAVEY